jgi:hypothetical protein
VKVARADNQVPVRWRHVDAAEAEALPLDRGLDRQSAASAEQLRQQAGRLIGDMEHDEERRRQIVRQASQQLLQRLEAAHRRTDNNDVAGCWIVDELRRRQSAALG